MLTNIQWRSKGGGKAHQHTSCSRLKTCFKQKLRSKYAVRKSPQRWGLRPRISVCLRWLGVPPPDPASLLSPTILLLALNAFYYPEKSLQYMFCFWFFHTFASCSRAQDTLATPQQTYHKKNIVRSYNMSPNFST